MRPLVSAALLALALISPVAPALAQDGAVKITADQFVADDKNKAATFSGNVVVTRDGMTLNANEVLISYGAGGENDIKSLVATGNVRIDTGAQKATGARAVYDPAAQILRLTGEVRVTASSGTMSGPELTLNLRDNTTTFKGSKSGRVTGVFTPQ